MLFAFSINNNTFVVSAGNAEELAERLDSICQDSREDFQNFSTKYIKPGIFIVESFDLPHAKKLATGMNCHLHIIFPDLPLFKSEIPGTRKNEI